ncbi:peptidoglycan DD-metalloendopeptidase family protein [Mobiluncus porci]|uniref:Peptidoglycan DD-metalloendopeptidase family protein n=1 Tax=Mobiluncus porci TaxID=2652278 RepID=A0A7K0K1W1_9ACTO|nr:peptidoglycan DD-metalloendopeptidase family protein [Mobiluncus porci]MST49477.1 peptidoglycan DD-metalloendopeptidase family protein [Mobiluncus porci]
MGRLALVAWPLVGAMVLSLGVTSSGAVGINNGVPTSPASSQIARLDNNAERKKLEEQQAAAKKREEEIAAQLEGVKADLVELAVQLERTKAAIPVAQADLASAQQKLGQAQREHQSIQARLKVAQTQKTQLQTDIDASEALISETQVTIGQIAQQAYRGGRLDTSAWTLLLDSKSVDELAMRAEVADTAAQSQNRVIQSAEEAKAAAANARARQEAVTIRIGELEAAAKEAVAAADAAKQEEQKQLVAIQTLQTQQVAQQGQLNNQRADFEKQIQQEKATQATAAARIAALNAAASGSARTISGGIFGSPLSSLRVTSSYGYRTHPVVGTRIFHAGTDFGMGCGQPIYASQSGDVTYAAWEGTGGNSVYINHGTINGSKWQTVYRHLSSYKISKGAHVEKGQVIGLVGTTGRSTGCHLHFEVWQNGKTINPMGVL